MQHLRLRIAHAVTLLPTGDIAFVKHACQCLVRQGREAGYPLLSKMIALDLISAPASQAYTERVFSVCGDLTAGKRNRMTRGLERRVFLWLNLKYVWTDSTELNWTEMWWVCRLYWVSDYCERLSVRVLLVMMTLSDSDYDNDESCYVL